MGESLPSAGRLISDTLKQTFEDRMDELLVDLGRKITLHLEPTIEDCPNCGFSSILKRSNNIYNSSNPNALGPLHKVFSDGQNCPVCGSRGVLKTPRSVEYTATIKKTFRDDQISSSWASIKNKLAKTNTVIDSYKDIIDCSHATIDEKMYKRLGDPVKTGLQSFIRVKCFWEMVE